MNLSTLAATQKECAKLREERDSLKYIFDLTYAAQMRAIAAWQERHDEPLTWPDHERLVLWLMEDRDALRALLATARAHMLGDGHGYDSEVVLAIDAALGGKP